MVEQITVFLENSEGRLSALCRTLADGNVNMSALTIADTTDYGVVRIICDNPQHALEVLSAADYRAVITQVSAIEVPNEPGGLARLLDVLADLDLNIEYGYCFSVNAGFAVDVLKIRESQKASEAADALQAAGFRMLTQSDLS